ncbi:MAG: hypothetical protein ACFFBH_02990 [Promethearchaeota archaeon]
MQKIKCYLPIKVQILILIIFVSTGIIIVNSAYLTNVEADENVMPMNCTIFTISDENNVFFGNSEDESGNRRYTEIRFSPATNGEMYGCAFLGFNGNEPGGDDIDGLAIGGINTEGLCFDANGILPASFVNYSPSLGPIMSSISCWEITLRECGSVSEVIEWYQTHNMGGWWGNQIHWADRTGNAVIVSPTPDHGIAFTNKTGDYLVSTNFNPVDHSQGWYPCERYELVTNRLEELSVEGEINRQDLIPILNAVSLPETEDYIGTVYSNIFDLKTQTIYLYIQRDFNHEVVFDLHNELEKGSHTYKIPSLAYSYISYFFWVLILSIVLLVSLVGIGFVVHFIYKKSHIRKSRKRKSKKNN